MRSTLGQSRSAGRWATWGLVALSLMITAKAGATTITETGTVTADTIEGLSGNNLNVNLVGQPFTLTTNFDPSTVGPLAGCTTTVCNSFGSGSTVFTAPGYNLTFPTGTTTADTVNSFYAWGPLTPGGQPALQMNVGPFASQTVGGSVIANGYNLVASAVGSSSSPIPDPATVNGSYSTSVSSNNALRINGASSILGQITSLAINATPSPSLYVNLAGGNPSSTGQPTKILATATAATSPPPLGTSYLVPNATLPPGTTTLQQAATALHFTGFDWVQQITQWVNPDLFPNTSPLNPITTADGPFYDPVAGGYRAPVGSTPNLSASPPFYYNVGTSPESDPYSVDANMNDFSGTSVSKCSSLFGLQPEGAATTLCFLDNPDDVLLTGAQIAAGLAPMFTTELAGLCDDPGVGACNLDGFDPLFSWKWTDTYNGNGCPENDASLCPGGITPYGLPSNAGPVYPGGTGGVTILDVDGVPVPEPSTLALLLSGIATLVFHRYRRRIVEDKSRGSGYFV